MVRVNPILQALRMEDVLTVQLRDLFAADYEVLHADRTAADFGIALLLLAAHPLNQSVQRANCMLPDHVVYPVSFISLRRSIHPREYDIEAAAVGA